MSRDDAGPCEGVDILPVVGGDDAIAVQCERAGRRVHETDELGHRRTRIACTAHAVEYDDVN